MNVDAYLKRINCEGLKEVTFENLKKLKKCHLQTVPFDNLDMHMGKHIELSLEKINDKIVNQSRGGYCLEVNSMFGWLLGELGYDYYYLPCYVYMAPLHGYMSNMIHIIVVVKIDGKSYYLDVGSSRYLNEPIEIITDKIQKQLFGTYQFTRNDTDPEFYVLERTPNKDYNIGKPNWTIQIKFKLVPQKLDDFKEMNEIVQRDGNGTVYYKTLNTLQTENSMRFLLGWKYVEVVFEENDERRTEVMLSSVDEVKKFLLEKFGRIVDESFKPKDEPYVLK